MKNKIVVVGTGYVGLANAVLLSQKNKVFALDIDKKRIDLLNKKISPIEDSLISNYLITKDLDLTPTLDNSCYIDSEYVVIATPTDYCTKTGYFNTKSIESVIKDILAVNRNCAIIIKSTIPVGYVDSIRKEFKYKDIFFSPEFLREGNALRDNLYPSRIIIGSKDNQKAHRFGLLLKRACKKHEAVVLYMDSTEAEAVKLFSNGYLAMRVAYFNELDSYCENNNLSTKDIITGVGLDPRIGKHYNNPSFGYGGYCFPKDLRQLRANFKNSGTPNNIINAITDSNQTRKEFIVSNILKTDPEVVGIHRLVMKDGSDNYRSSSIEDIIKMLVGVGIEVVIYEPYCKEESFVGGTLIDNLEDFKNKSDIIITNRLSKELEDVKDKVYTRDIFNSDI